MKAFIGLLMWLADFLQLVASVYGVEELGSTLWDGKTSSGLLAEPSSMLGDLTTEKILPPLLLLLLMLMLLLP